MLGLGTNMLRDSSNNTASVGPDLLYTYESDFSSSDDGWIAFNVAGTDSRQPGQNAPGEPTTNDWLKITYDADQGPVGILVSDWLPDSFDPILSRKVGDFVTFECKVHLVDGGNDYWDGTDPVDVRFSSTGTGTVVEVQPDITTNISVVNTSTTVNWNTAISVVTSSAVDLPNSGASWYIKDIKLNLYRY